MRSMATRILAAIVPLVSMSVGWLVPSAQAAVGDIVDIPDIAACAGVALNVGLTTTASRGVQFTTGKYREFGTDIPVILIHGYDGMNKGQWGTQDNPTDFNQRINAIPGAKVAAEFQYDSIPVYDANFGRHAQPFANAVDYLSQISKQNGGRGKVVVVGYSEGSAIAHSVSVKTSTDNLRSIGAKSARW